MEYIAYFVDLFLHLDKHLAELASNEDLSRFIL